MDFRRVRRRAKPRRNCRGSVCLRNGFERRIPMTFRHHCAQLGPALLLLSGCALHADMLELNKEVQSLKGSQEQAVKSQAQVVERMKEMENRLRLDELQARLKDLETRLARIEIQPTSSVASSGPARLLPAPVPEPTKPEPSRQSKPIDLPAGTDGGFMVPGTPDISPTSAFNLAYNDYLNGRYELAVSGFQRFLKDFPSTSLTPSAHYMIGESYYSAKDFPKAMLAFERVINEFGQSEKVPPALYKLGVSSVETGDAVRAREYLKRIIEKFPTSEEAKLAKNKLAALR
ncbi:MAG: tol-pal system protein YbgF [Nitrospira sp.]|nr:MAG: tol-pal system protein YbgF [Nitrospira sp.]